MNKILKIKVAALTPFNISTGNKSNGFIKNLTIRDVGGNPYIPGSSIKGLIKDNYRLLNDNISDIFGGEGYNPSKIIVDDIKLEDGKQSEAIVRFGNAIDRYRGVAKDNALYSKEVVKGTFEGKVYLYDVTEEQCRDIEAAIKMITAVGGSKSTGFGKVKVEIEDISIAEDLKNSEKNPKINKEIPTNDTDSEQKFVLEFVSPLIIGNKKKSSNFVDSDDVIKGSVVRAAFAKVILKECLYFKPGEKYADKDSAGNIIYRNNWVHFRSGEQCKNCKLMKTCKKFSEINFSYFYPFGTECIPLTSKMCKKNSHHGFYDALLGDDKCTICSKKDSEDAKIDFESGLRTKYSECGKLEKYSPTKTVATKNAINPYTKTAEDGMLYSVESVSASHIVKGKEGQPDTVKLIYEGIIKGIPEEELYNFRNLRIGADTTVGFGKCRLIPIENDKNNIENANIINLIENFNEKYKKAFCIEDAKTYIAVKFNSDCKLDFEFKAGYITSKDIKKTWNNALWKDVQFKNEKIVLLKPEEMKVDKVFTEFINYRGYDSSIIGDDKREKPVRIAAKGTVIVFSADCPINDENFSKSNETREKNVVQNKLYNHLKNVKGFGLEQENGYGDFEIYFGGVEYAK